MVQRIYTRQSKISKLLSPDSKTNFGIDCIYAQTQSIVFLGYQSDIVRHSLIPLYNCKSYQTSIYIKLRLNFQHASEIGVFNHTELPKI